MKPPGCLPYWLSREVRKLPGHTLVTHAWSLWQGEFAAERARFDSQHAVMDKDKDEYREWKRKHDEDLQRAIKNHPIASVFLDLTKNA